MSKIRLVSQSELTQAIAGRLQALWDAYLQADGAAHSAILTEEYRAVHADGTVHVGKPSAEEIAAAPMEDYWITELQAWPTGDEAAIATYTAEVEVRSGLSAKRFKFEVGEVWLKVGGDWKCRYYHATTRK
jgi:hypothetical protein